MKALIVLLFYRLFHLGAIVSGWAAVLYTVYDKHYYPEYGKLSIPFFAGIVGLGGFLLYKLHKKINEKAQRDRNGIMVDVDRFPTLKSLYRYGVVIGITFTMWQFFLYVESNNDKVSHTWEIIFVSWLVALGFRLISVVLEKYWYRLKRAK